MPYDPTTARWVPTPTRVPGFETDVIPTQYAPPPSQSRYTNADLPRAPLMGLSDAQKRAQQEQEVYERLQRIPLERSGEDLLASAKDHLYRTRPFADNPAQEAMSRYAPLQAADLAAEEEQLRTEEASSPWGAIKYGLQAGLGAGSFVPGPIGAASMAGLAGISGISAIENAMEGDYGEAAFDVGVGALPYAGRIKQALTAPQMGRLGLKQVPVGAVRRSVQASNLADEGLSRAAAGQKAGIPGAGQSSELSYAAPSSPFSNVEHYYDARDLGMAGDKAAKVIGGRDKGAVEALRSLDIAGRQGRSSRFDRWADRNVEEYQPSLTSNIPELVPVGGEEVFNLTRGQAPRTSWLDWAQSLYKR